MSIEVILDRLNHVKGGNGQWRCQCPCNHKSHSQMSIKELPDGRILIHCHAGHSPSEIMESLDLGLGDLFEEALADRIRPLYMATQEKKRAATALERINHCQLRLDMAEDMRNTGRKLTQADMKVERECLMELLQLKGAMA